EGGQVLVGGEDFGGGQVPAGEAGGAGRIPGGFYPGAFQRFFLAAFRRGRVSGDDRPVHRGPQLPGGLPSGLGDDEGFDRGGVLVVQAGQLISDHGRAALVDLPGGQRRAGQREPVQREGQVQDPCGGG